MDFSLLIAQSYLLFRLALSANPYLKTPFFFFFLVTGSFQKSKLCDELWIIGALGCLSVIGFFIASRLQIRAEKAWILKCGYVSYLSGYNNHILHPFPDNEYVRTYWIYYWEDLHCCASTCGYEECQNDWECWNNFKIKNYLNIQHLRFGVIVWTIIYSVLFLRCLAFDVFSRSFVGTRTRWKTRSITRPTWTTNETSWAMFNFPIITCCTCKQVPVVSLVLHVYGC